MKKLFVLCLLFSLCMTLVFCLTACDSGNQNTDTVPETVPATDAPTEEITEAPTEAPTEEVTEAPTEAPTEEATEEGTKAPSREDYPEDQYVVIETPEDLMAFNKRVNEDFDDLTDMTVIFLSDIDLSDYEWTPLDGNAFCGTTFEGKGYTISNMTINYNTERDISGNDSCYGCGFIGTLPSGCDVYVYNLNFDSCTVIARERHVGCVVGRSIGANCEFENVSVTNFTVDGWCDYNNASEETDGYPICFRVGGVMGATWGGTHLFTNVTVKNLKISGFHNLAGILGYDGSGVIDAYAFENCRVENAEMIFSYCLGASYTVDMPRKFVSVFYNGANWVDNIDECVENGNTFDNVSFLDWTDDNHEYTPVDFRSWTQEEKDAAS